MHKSFYASGFLYNLKTQQILLLKPQSDQESPKWSLFGGEGLEGEDPQIAFQRIVLEKLGIDLKLKKIYPIYDYFDKNLDKTGFIFYAEIGKTPTFSPINEKTPSWVTFTQTLKLPFLSQTKQDIMVGERVINLKAREDEASKLGALILNEKSSSFR